MDERKKLLIEILENDVVPDSIKEKIIAIEDELERVNENYTNILNEFIKFVINIESRSDRQSDIISKLNCKILELENQLYEKDLNKKLTEEEKNKIEFDHHFQLLPNGILMQKCSAHSPFYQKYTNKYYKLHETCELIKEFIEYYIQLPIPPDDLKNKLSHEIFVFVYDKIFRS